MARGSKLTVAGKYHIVCTLHDVDLALRLFPRIIALRDGRVAFDSPSQAVSREVLDELYGGESSQHELASAQ